MMVVAQQMIKSSIINKCEITAVSLQFQTQLHKSLSMMFSQKSLPEQIFLKNMWPKTFCS